MIGLNKERYNIQSLVTMKGKWQQVNKLNLIIEISQTMYMRERDYVTQSRLIMS